LIGKRLTGNYSGSSCGTGAATLAQFFCYGGCYILGSSLNPEELSGMCAVQPAPSAMIGKNPLLLHLFFNCPRVISRWQIIFGLLSTTDLTFGCISTPIMLLHKAIKASSPTCLIIVAEVLWNTWRERNAFVYQGNSSAAPPATILQSALLRLKALLSTTTSQQKHIRLEQDRITLERCLTSLPPLPTRDAATPNSFNHD
jgi:hypothetical protein